MKYLRGAIKKNQIGIQIRWRITKNYKTDVRMVNLLLSDVDGEQEENQ